MWLSTSGILLLFLCVSPTISKEACPDNVIKEAIISLAHIMRENSQKLERHEVRERQLGDWMKKAVGALSKKANSFENLKIQLSKIEDRMAGIEQLISQRDERERIQIQKTANSIENLENHLMAEIEHINSTIWKVSRSVEAARLTLNAESITSDIMAKLNETEAQFVGQIATLEFGLTTMSNKNDVEATKRFEELESLSVKSDARERRLVEKTENLIENLEKRLGAQIEDMNSMIFKAGNKCLEPTPPTLTAESMKSEIITKLENMEAQFVGQIARIEFDLNNATAQNVAEVKKQAQVLEKLYAERDETEGKQMNKTADLVEDLEKLLEGKIERINSTISKVCKCVEPTPPTLIAESITSAVISKLNETEANFIGRVARIEFDLNQATLKKNEDDAAALRSIFSEVKNISVIVTNIEESLEKLNEAAEENKKEEEENRKASEDVIDVAAMIEEQNKALNNVTELLEDTANRVQGLPTQLDIETFHNETQAALQETKSALEGAMINRTSEVIDRVGENIKAINKSVDALRLLFVNHTQKVNAELENLVAGQGVMVVTAEEIFEMKKKLEFGIHRIIADVSEVIKNNSELINKTLNDKVDVLSLDIISNQSKALASLATKMQDKLNQVWRQINLMSEKMTESATTLNKLQEQNQDYINDTTSTMDGIKTKVGDITDRVHSMTTELNNLMGQLGLTTKEFNRVKSGLSTALDNMKTSFREIQEQANITKPGRNDIPPNSLDFDENVVLTDGGTHLNTGLRQNNSTALIDPKSN